MTRQVIVNILFFLLDIVSLTLCSWYLVSLMPSNKYAVRKHGRLRILKAAAWTGYAALTVLLPNLGHNDFLTMAVLSVYYILTGYLLYHRDKTGILYQLGFMFFMYATQIISILAAARFYAVFSLEQITYVYTMILLKAGFLLIITVVFRILIQKRFVSVQPRLKLRECFWCPSSA